MLFGVFFRALPLALLSVYLVACAVQPPQQDLEMGETAYRQARENLPFITSGKEYERVQRIGSHIAAVADTDFTQFEFGLIDDDILNAWSLPGGKIAIYKGLLDTLDDDAEVAAVLGHEAAHATLRHAAKKIARATPAIAPFAIVSNTVDGVTGTTIGRATVGSVGAAGTQLILSPYSRKSELEADAEGARFMARAGYDPIAAIAVWQRLAMVRDDADGPLAYLSTHPNDDTRIENLEAQLPELKRLYDAAPVKRDP